MSRDSLYISWMQGQCYGWCGMFTVDPAVSHPSSCRGGKSLSGGREVLGNVRKIYWLSIDKSSSGLVNHVYFVVCVVSERTMPLLLVQSLTTCTCQMTILRLLLLLLGMTRTMAIISYRWQSNGFSGLIIETRFTALSIILPRLTAHAHTIIMMFFVWTWLAGFPVRFLRRAVLEGHLLGINGTGRMSLLHNQQCKSTEGNTKRRPQPVNISHWWLFSSFLHPPSDC